LGLRRATVYFSRNYYKELLLLSLLFWFKYSSPCQGLGLGRIVQPIRTIGWYLGNTEERLARPKIVQVAQTEPSTVLQHLPTAVVHPKLMHPVHVLSFTVLWAVNSTTRDASLVRGRLKNSNLWQFDCWPNFPKDNQNRKFLTATTATGRCLDAEIWVSIQPDPFSSPRLT
jgi:hypothetical protein